MAPEAEGMDQPPKPTPESISVRLGLSVFDIIYLTHIYIYIFNIYIYIYYIEAVIWHVQIDRLRNCMQGVFLAVMSDGHKNLQFLFSISVLNEGAVQN